jgi:hypothetical protein
MKRSLILFIAIPTILLFGQSKILRQSVRIWPAGYDTTGKHWVVYNCYKPTTHWVIETSVGSTTLYSAASNFIRWSCDIGNFNGGASPWLPGDTIICFGSWDSAYAHNPAGYSNNPNHYGFFWVYSDTVTPATPETWSPDDTLRLMPKPIVTMTGPGGIGNDTIWIKIPNPPETRRIDQTLYDILGYRFWADSSGAGTPDRYNNPTTTVDIGFVSTQGIYGDTTVLWFLESEYFVANTSQPVCFAYRIVARPDTTSAAADTMGYSSYYLSQNSDQVTVYHDIIGVEEQGSTKKVVPLMVTPNPSKGQVVIRLGDAEGCLKIYDASGKLVRMLPAAQDVVWNGSDETGVSLPSGVYFIELKTEHNKYTEKVILQR